MLTIIIEIIGVIGYLYLSWRTLRDNYQEEDIIAFSWVALLLFLIGGRVVFGFWNWGIWSGNPGAWLEFWKMKEMNILGASIFWVAFSLLIIKDKGWKIWSFFESSLISFTWLLLTWCLLVKNWFIIIAWIGAVILTLPMIKRYRSLTWFKSGKKGFLFFWLMIWFWLILVIVTKVWWEGGISLLFIVGLFILGNDKLSK